MKIDQNASPPESAQTLLAALGASLRAQRLSKRLTHEDVVKVCGFSRQTLSRIEKGDASVAVGQIARYAELLGIEGSLLVPSPAAPSVGSRVRRTRKEKESLQGQCLSH